MEDNQLLETIGESMTVTKIPKQSIYFIQENINTDNSQTIKFSEEIEPGYFSSGITDLALIEILIDRVDNIKKFEPYRNQLNMHLLDIIDYLTEIEKHG